MVKVRLALVNKAELELGFRVCEHCGKRDRTVSLDRFDNMRAVTKAMLEGERYTTVPWQAQGSILVEAKSGYEVIERGVHGQVVAIHHVFFVYDNSKETPRNYWNMSTTYVGKRQHDVDDVRARTGAWW